MSKLFTKLSAVALVSALSLPVYAQEELTPDSVIATVNGTEITLGHMIMVRASLPEQYQSMPDTVLWDGILDQLVQQTLVGQLLGEQVSKRVELAMQNERRSLEAAVVIEGIVDDAVTEETVRAYYEEEFVAGEPTEEFNASHILVETEEEAATIIEEIAAGALFEDVARVKSTGPSGPNGGNLGWFGPGMMVPEFQAAVEELEVGEVSAPVQTQFGWHVITLNDKRNQEAPALEDVRAEIENQLSQQAVDARIEDLTAEAAITRMDRTDLDVSILNDIEQIEN